MNNVPEAFSDVLRTEYKSVNQLVTELLFEEPSEQRSMREYGRIVDAEFRGRTLAEIPVERCREILDYYRARASGKKPASGVVSEVWQRKLDVEKKYWAAVEMHMALKYRRTFSPVAMGFAVLGAFDAFSVGGSGYSLLFGVSAIAAVFDRFLRWPPTLRSPEKFIASVTAIAGSAAVFHGAGPLRWLLPGYALLITFGLLVAPWLQYRQITRPIRWKERRFVLYTKVPKLLRPILKRLEAVLQHVAELRLAQVSGRSPNGPALQAFEAGCIEFLRGHLDVAALSERRRAAYREIRRVPHAGKVSETMSNPSAAAAAPAPLKEIEYPETLQFIVSLGISEEDAHRIARTIRLAEAKSVFDRLAQILSQEAACVVTRANPGLFFMRGEARAKYFGALPKALHRITEKHGTAPPEEMNPHSNPALFATTDGLEYLVEMLRSKAQGPIALTPTATLLEKIDVRRYPNRAVLDAVLAKGFSLDSGSPKIGMSYRSIDYVLSRTRNHCSEHDMQEFSEVFGNLIADGVILTEKGYKGSGGGGAFSGCYSVSPSLQRVRVPELRALIKHYLYQTKPS